MKFNAGDQVRAFGEPRQMYVFAKISEANDIGASLSGKMSEVDVSGTGIVIEATKPIAGIQKLRVTWTDGMTGWMWASWVEKI